MVRPLLRSQPYTSREKLLNPYIDIIIHHHLPVSQVRQRPSPWNYNAH
jgi:hypothetical protein